MSFPSPGGGDLNLPGPWTIWFAALPYVNIYDAAAAAQGQIQI